MREFYHEIVGIIYHAFILSYFSLHNLFIFFVYTKTIYVNVCMPYISEELTVFVQLMTCDHSGQFISKLFFWYKSLKKSTLDYVDE